MLKNQNIICISSIDWDFIWQGHQEIMSELSKNGNRILFIENTGVRVPGIRDFRRIKNRIKNWLAGVKGIRQVRENLYVFSPIVLPFPYSRFARLVNRHLMLSLLDKWTRIMDFYQPILWVFLPTPLSLDVADNFNHKLLIYYCIDNFRVSSISAAKIQSSEIKLLQKADLVFVTSRELYNYSSQYNNKVYFFPFAVSFQKFQEARLKKGTVPEELRDIKKPVVGYVGGVHKWIDFVLIRKAAERYPQYSFVFVGPVQTDITELSGLKNVHFLGAKEHNRIPDFVNNFSACLIPYLITDYTKNVYPTKLNEYHALGKPVVSTDLPEVADFNRHNDNLVLVGGDGEGFINCIAKAVDDSSQTLADKRIASAGKNSWPARIEEMCALAQDSIESKSRAPFNWKVDFLRAYRAWRRKMVKIAAVAACSYLLIFYTPLIWFLARPLKITQSAQKADAILVFAGGVGESGKAVQGYEERVDYAVELYKKGYAENLVFFSGYSRIFKEPLLMKGLALALRVPEGAIILEDRAQSVYGYAKCAKEISGKKGWKKVLLVSTPYNMLRVSLVFKKLNGDLTVFYNPVQKSSFYAHPVKDAKGRTIWKRASFEQIRGILQEYSALAYYYFKGYI